MRPQRKRKAVQRDSDFVDVDSDELMQLIEEEQEEKPRKTVQSSTSTRTAPKRAKTAKAAAAAAGGDDSDYEPGEMGMWAGRAPAAHTNLTCKVQHTLDPTNGPHMFFLTLCRCRR